MGGMASAIGGVITKVGESLLKGVSSFAENLVDKVVNWVKEVFSISETPSYDRENATIDETKKINELLQKCVDNYGDEAKKYEEFAKEILEEYLENVYETLEVFKKDNIIPDYIFKSLNYQTEILSNSIDNLYISGINNVFSLNNNQLLDVLKLNSGREKEKKIQEIAINALNTTNDIFIKKINHSLKIQQDLIIEELKKLLDSKNREKYAIEEEFDKIKNQRDVDLEELNETITGYKNMIKKLDLIN